MMDKKTFWICTGIGFAISQILLSKLTQKRQEEEAKAEREAMLKVNPIVKKMREDQAKKAEEEFKKFYE